MNSKPKKSQIHIVMHQADPFQQRLGEAINALPRGKAREFFLKIARSYLGEMDAETMRRTMMALCDYIPPTGVIVTNNTTQVGGQWEEMSDHLKKRAASEKQPGLGEKKAISVLPLFNSSADAGNGRASLRNRRGDVAGSDSDTRGI